MPYGCIWHIIKAVYRRLYIVFRKFKRFFCYTLSYTLFIIFEAIYEILYAIYEQRETDIQSSEALECIDLIPVTYFRSVNTAL